MFRALLKNYPLAIAGLVFCLWSITPFLAPLTIGSTDTVKVVKYEELHGYLHQDVDEIRIINFWATWCAPCIKEMPHFESLPSKWGYVPLKVLFISLDFPEEANGKVMRFIERRGIKNEVWLLDETDFNAFIDRVDPSWSGAIPATLILGPGLNTRKFLEKELQEGELESLLSELFR
jgi:thiol-disulfide isomerase/thioredoxin